ncbi:MAG TPA: glucose-6-phosphate isomerase, partial [Allocoleopsis sp.]
MDAIALWDRYQNWLYYHPGLELYLDVSRISFDDAFVQAMEPKFEKAFTDMEALEKGAIANPDENRQVGHYWLRSPNIAPPEFQQEIIQGLNDIESFAQKIHSGEIKPPNADKFTDIISIGIGGSALGPQFVAEALAPDVPPLNIHFIDNSDPTGIDKLFAHLKNRLPSTLVLVISKSGSTPEPRNGMIEVKNFFASQNIPFAPHFVAVTMPGSLLDKQAQ